jgi:hypothetical protein
MAKCFVSYLDVSGVRHTIEVDAETMYEAAALALKSFKEHELEPGAMANLEVEIRKTITHTLTVKRLHEWLNGACRAPNEKVIKERLKELIK